MKTAFTILFFYLLVYQCSLKADDIYLKNGKAYYNVTISDSTDNIYILRFYPTGTAKVLKNDIVKLIRKVAVPELGSKFDDADFDIENYLAIKKETELKSKIEETLNDKNALPTLLMQKKKVKLTFLLPVSVIAFGLTYDYLKQADNIQSTIDFYKKYNPNTDTGSLESEKSRKTVLGVLFGLVGVANTILSFQEVEIYSTPSEIGISYNF
jgi:hypothetical protein